MRRIPKKEVKRFAKYMAGGGVYFWVGYGVFALCYSGLHWDWLPSKIAADVIGWSLNYLVQRFWAFSDQIHLGEMQHASRYVIIESIGFVLDYGIIFGLNALGVSPYIGFFVSAGFFSIWSYLWYKYWVFQKNKNTSLLICTYESIKSLMSKNNRLHMHSHLDAGFVPISEVAAKLQFPQDCLERCDQLNALLNGQVVDTPRASNMIREKLQRAQCCSGPEKKFLGRTACGSEL